MLSAALASETRKAAKDSASEGNRSERGNGGGSLSPSSSVQKTRLMIISWLRDFSPYFRHYIRDFPRALGQA